MKTDYNSLDTSILELVAAGAQPLNNILNSGAVREIALRVARRRAGTAPSESADETTNERLQELRRAGKIGFDRATSRWTVLQDISALKPEQ